jgi:hypothetical protein
MQLQPTVYHTISPQPYQHESLNKIHVLPFIRGHFQTMIEKIYVILPNHWYYLSYHLSIAYLHESINF